MLNLGDRVKHQETGKTGIVVGFGKRIVNNKCLPTAKVETTDPKSNKKAIVKDLDTKWLPCPKDFKVMHPDPLNKYRIFKPTGERVRETA